MTAKFFSGKHVQEKRKQYISKRAKHQSNGSKTSKRNLKKLSGKERRFKRNTNHIISKNIVQFAKRHKLVICLENLQGISKRVATVSKSQRNKFSTWAFFELKQFIKYKAGIAGVQIIEVDPRNTSRLCPCCGHVDKKNRPTQDDFRCVKCGLSGRADHIAAFNIQQRGSAAYAALHSVGWNERWFSGFREPKSEESLGNSRSQTAQRIEYFLGKKPKQRTGGSSKKSFQKKYIQVQTKSIKLDKPTNLFVGC